MLEKLLTPIAYVIVAPLWIRYWFTGWQRRRQIAADMRAFAHERHDVERIMESVFPR